MKAFRLAFAALACTLSFAATAQLPRPGTVDMELNLTDLRLQPFSLSPDGGTAAVAVTAGTSHFEATFHSPDNVLHDISESQTGFDVFYLSADGKQYPWDALAHIERQSYLGKLTAELEIDNPHTPYELFEASYDVNTTLSVTPNTGLIIYGHLVGTQISNQINHFSNEISGDFSTLLTGPGAGAATYARSFGLQGGPTGLDEWFSLTLYNHSDETVDFSWQTTAALRETLAVPEPGRLGMMLAGLMVLVGAGRWRAPGTASRQGVGAIAG
ncbi:MAG TPA: PEP-CTERM sorting domain-containing protein [Pseudoduganella sp.]